MEQGNTSNMMPLGGMPNTPANPNSMQRPQAGNLAQQIHAKVLNDIRQTAGQLTGGWQATFDARERANWVMQLVTGLRVLEPLNIPKCLQIAQSFESRSVLDSQNKEEYHSKIQLKLREIHARRTQTAGQAMQNGQAPGMPGMPGMMQNNMMGMNHGMPTPQNSNMDLSMGNMPMAMNPGQLNLNPMQNNAMFPTQLQRQLQPSPIPPAQSNTMDPSLLHQNNQVQPSQQGLQMNPPGQPMNVPPEQQANRELFMMAKKHLDSMPEERKRAMRSKVLEGMTPIQRTQMAQSGQDPLLKPILASLMKARAQQNGAGVQMGANNVNNNNGGGQVGNSFPARPPSQTGTSSNFDMSSMLGQQANAMRSQESGEQVVPASRNANMGFGNPMGMPQNINPQMLGQMGNMGRMGSQPSTAGMNPQQLLQQQNAQAQERAQKQQLMAQQHQQAMLRGQPGGLHAPNFNAGSNAGQMHSPAMPMLNRPLGPQQTPTTPQPNHQLSVSSTPNSNAALLAQHHQNMVNQNNQQPPSSQNPGGQQSLPIHQMNAFISRMPENVRSRLMQMPPQQQFEVIRRMQRDRKSASGSNVGPPDTTVASNQQHPQPTPGTVQNNAGVVGPGFSATQAPQNPGPQQSAQDANRSMQLSAMDTRPFPRGILQQLNLNVPQQVGTWRDLKQHIQQHLPTLMPNLFPQIQMLQARICSSVPTERDAVLQIVSRMKMAAQGQAPPQHNNPQTVTQPPAGMVNRQPPHAQIVPPAAPMQAQPASGSLPGQFRNPQIQPPVPAEIQAFKQKVPQAEFMSDDQIAAQIMRMKYGRIQQLQLQQRQQAGQQAGQQPGQQPGQQGRQPVQNPAAPSGNMSTGNAQNPRMPQVPLVQQQNRQGAPQIQRSAANDDIEIIASQPAQPQAAPATMQPNRAPKPPSRVAAENSARVAQPPQTQQPANARPDSLRPNQMMHNSGTFNGQIGGQGIPQSAQQPATRPAPIDKQRVLAMQHEIGQAAKGPSVQLDSAALEQAKIVLKKLWIPLQKLDQALPILLQLPNVPERRIRDILETKHLVQQNVDEHGNLRGYCSLTIQKLRELSIVVQGYVNDMKTANEVSKKRNAAQANGMQPGIKQPAAAMKPGQPVHAPQAVPPQNPIKKASNSSKAPAAPTEDKRFDWGGPSPHGIPKYDGRNELTQDKLKFPPNKKRPKPESQASTPAGQVGTPAAVAASPGLGNVKMPGAEPTRKTQLPARPEAETQPAPKRYLCQDLICDSHLQGFETEEQLKLHQTAEHAPMDNALEFLLAEGAKYAGVDADGNPLAGKKDDEKRPQVQAKPESKFTISEVLPGKQAQKPKDKLAEAASSSAAKVQNFEEALWEKLGYQPSAKEKKSLAEDAIFIDDQPDELAWLRESSPLSDCGTDWAGIEAVVMSQYREWQEKQAKSDSSSSDALTPASGSVSSSPSGNTISPRQQLKLSLKMHDWDPFGDGNQGVPEELYELALAERKRIAEAHDARVNNDRAAAHAEQEKSSNDDATNSKKRKTPDLDDEDFPMLDFSMFINEDAVEWPKSPHTSDAQKKQKV